MYNLYGVINQVFYLIKNATYIVASLALLYFFWGLAELILKSSDDEKRKESIQKLIWGLVALFVLLSIAGIINLLQFSFGLDVHSSWHLLERL